MNISKQIYSSILLPNWCLTCHQYLQKTYAFSLCPTCYQKIVFWNKDLCPKCNHFHPFLPCESNTVPNLDQVYTICLYNEILHNLISELKYKKNLVASHFLGLLLSHYMKQQQNEWKKFVGIVPIPTYKERLRKRGFNQTYLLATKQSYLPIISTILYRPKSKKHQAGLSQLERSYNIIGSFKNNHTAQPKAYLLFDDIFTTGSTLNEAAKILKQAGATHVSALTLGHT